jgi:hypothetical protein
MSTYQGDKIIIINYIKLLVSPYKKHNTPDLRLYDFNFMIYFIYNKSLWDINNYRNI